MTTVCLHFDHKLKRRCTLANGRMAPRDCKGCASYLGESYECPAKQAEWDKLHMRIVRAGT